MRVNNVWWAKMGIYRHEFVIMVKKSVKFINKYLRIEVFFYDNDFYHF